MANIWHRNSILLILIVLSFCSFDNPATAQEIFDEFQTRVLSDYIYTQHLYRDKLVKDRYRPIYDFASPEIGAHPFDPNGAIYWNGRYHLFYMIQPYRPREGHRGNVWAHISSHDLIHWRHLPTALKPEKDGPEVAIYSGNAFLDRNGTPTIMYQYLGAGNCIAQALDDDLNTWKKSDANPVIPYPEYNQDNDGDVFRSILDKLPDYGEYDVWDPHGWLDGDTYYSISGNNGVWPGDKVSLWKSYDLEKWQLVGDFFHHGEPEDVLDCPDVFKLGDKYVLLYLSKGLRYAIGEFKNEQFYPEKDETMSWRSGVGYAPETLLDPNGRRIMWAALYDRRTNWGNVDEFGMRVLCSPDGRELTTISYIPAESVVRVDLSKTSLDPENMKDVWFPLVQEAILDRDSDESLEFHVFIDKSVLEIFVNGKLSLTHRVYPSLVESKEIRLYSVGGRIDIPEINAWKMHPSNPW